MHMFEALLPVRPGVRAQPVPPKQLGRLFGSAVVAWNDDYGSSLGAALALYALACLALLLLVALAGGSLVLDTASGQRALQALLGGWPAASVTAQLHRGYAAADLWLATAVGLGGLAVAAAALFGELQDALNRIWRAPLPRPAGLWRLVRERPAAFALLLAVGVVVLVSLSLNGVFAALDRDAALGLEAINLGVSLALLAVALAALYRSIPRVVIDWRDVRIGAAGSALLLTLGVWLLGFYLGRGAAASPVGVAETLIALVFWAYCSAQIFVLGAHFTRVLASAHGAQRTHPPALPAIPGSRRHRNAGQMEAPILVKPWPYERAAPRSTTSERVVRP